MKVALKGPEVCFLTFCRLCVRVLGYRCIHQVAEQAFRLLSTYDPEACEELKKIGGFVWYHPTYLVGSPYSGTYSVTDKFLNEDAAGFLARLVWVYYQSVLFRQRYFFPSERCLGAAMNAKVKTDTGSWLRQHGFSEDVVSLAALS